MEAISPRRKRNRELPSTVLLHSLLGQPVSSLNFQLSTVSSGPSMLAVVRRGSDSHAPKLIAVILLEEHVPLFAALEDFFLVRRDLFADIQLNLLFFLQRSRQDQHHLLPDGVPIIHKFHVVARHQHVRNLVRQSHDLFPAQSHPSSSLSNRASSPVTVARHPQFPVTNFEFLISHFQPLSQNQLAIPRQLLLRLLVHLLIRNARTPHLVLMHNQELAHFLVEPVFDGELFHHPQPHAVDYGVGCIRFNVAALHQAFHHFFGHVRHVIPDNQHLYAFPLRISKKTSLLAARTKCKEGRRIARNFCSLVRRFILSAAKGMPRPIPAINANLEAHSHTKREHMHSR